MRHTPCGCRSAHLVEVQPNFRLPPVLHNAASAAMPHSARSLPPSKRHSRLTIVRRGCKTVTNRRGFMAKPCTPHPIPQRCAALRATDCQCAGSRGSSPRLSLGGSKGGILFRKENTPFDRQQRLQRCIPPPRCARKEPLLPARQPPFTPLGVKQFRGVLCQKNS